MAKTFTTVAGVGTADQPADSGTASIRFVFPVEEDESAAAGLAAGFLDALLDTFDPETSGLDAPPSTTDIAAARRIDGGFQAEFGLHLHMGSTFHVAEWLDQSGLLDDPELVSTIVTGSSWFLSTETFAETLLEARAVAVDNAEEKALDYASIVDGRGMHLAGIVERRVLIGADHIPTGDHASLDDYLATTPDIEVVVELDATFTIRR
jgi:hypothetical protein